MAPKRFFTSPPCAGDGTHSAGGTAPPAPAAAPPAPPPAVEPCVPPAPPRPDDPPPVVSEGPAESDPQAASHAIATPDARADAAACHARFLRSRDFTSRSLPPTFRAYNSDSAGGGRSAPLHGKNLAGGGSQ